MSDKIILIDGNSLLHRAYHALPGLKTSKGMYTGAIFGFLRLTAKLVKEQKPTHIAVAFDLKAPTFRHKMFDGYKATRKPMDAELAMQVEPLKELLTAMRLKVVSLEGYEADDILGTLSLRFDEDTIIVTGDRDSFQLVNESTRIFWTRKGVTDIVEVTPESLLSDGFTVEKFIDYKALRGDPSDNIPGIKGVGEKTAKDLLDKYGSLDEVLARADEIPGKLGEAVKNGKEIALLSRTLATIDREVPVDCTLDDMAFNPVFPAEVRTMLQELELNSIVQTMQFEEGESVAQSVKREIAKEEVTSLDGIKEKMTGEKVALLIGDEISFSTDGGTEYVVSCGDDLFAEMTVDGALEEIKNLVKDKTLVCYDSKSTRKKYGIEGKDFFDIMIATHLVRESAPIKSIDAVLGSEGLEICAANILYYSDVLKAQIAEKGLERLFYDVEQPLSVVLGKMEERGFSVEADRLDALKVKYTDIVDDLTKRIYSSVGFEFNVASPKQLGEVLFEKLGLKHGKKTKTGYSVSEDVLSGLISEHPVIPLILEWRRYTKLLSTYVVGLQPLVNRGKIHTEFNQCITTTGRLSSTNPNLQNIPVRSEEAKDVKSAFVASGDNVLVSADYSQIELRLLAHFSGDEKLIEAYNRADDIHAMTASQILGIPQEEITPSQRRDAKAVNFGIIYGMSDFGLAENLAIPKYKAREFIERYFETYPTVKEYLDGNVVFAKEHGYAVTLLGRRRNLSDINASNYLVRSSAERMSKNTPLQGSAADIIKLAMLGVEKRLEGMKSKMILQVHDELIVDTAPDEIDEVKKILQEEMENAVSLRVPLIAEAVVGKKWSDLK